MTILMIVPHWITIKSKSIVQDLLCELDGLFVLELGVSNVTSQWYQMIYENLNLS